MLNEVMIFVANKTVFCFQKDQNVTYFSQCRECVSAVTVLADYPAVQKEEVFFSEKAPF